MSNTPENPYASQTPSAPYNNAPAGKDAYGNATYGGPSAPAPYNGGQNGPAGVDPGKTLAIVGLILPFVGLSLVGLILGIVAKIKSSKAGYSNGLALAAIIVSAVFLVVSIIVSIFLINGAITLAQAVEACANGAESVTINGETISCSSVS